MQHVGNIFLYNNNQNNKNLYHHNLKEMGYFLFDTDEELEEIKKELLN